MSAGDAQGLIEHGDLGLMALVILVVVVPIVSGMVSLLVWQIRLAGKQQVQARTDFMSVIAETGERQERTTVALTEVSVGSVAALGRLCNRLEERPCLLGARLGNGEEEKKG